MYGNFTTFFTSSAMQQFALWVWNLNFLRFLPTFFFSFIEPHLVFFILLKLQKSNKFIFNRSFSSSVELLFKRFLKYFFIFLLFKFSSRPHLGIEHCFSTPRALHAFIRYSNCIGFFSCCSFNDSQHFNLHTCYRDHTLSLRVRELPHI